MPLVLDATPGGPAANSYATVEESAAYFLARRNADAWASATPDTQAQALTAATQRLEQEQFVGIKTAQTQALKWPRVGVFDEDGRLIPQTDVPGVVKAATAELALYLLNQGATDPFQPTGLEPFTALSLAGSVNLTPAQRVAGQLPPQVIRLLRNYLSTSTGVTRLVRA